MASWQPNVESLQTLAACLKDSLSGFDKNAQKRAELMLNQAKASPDFNNYLALIFSSVQPPNGITFTPQDYHLVRSSAAVMLKNNVKGGVKKIPEQSLALIKMAIPIGLQDQNSQIRNYAGNIAAEMFRSGGLLGWPELLPTLLGMLSNEGGNVPPQAQEGAMAAMAKICEDSGKTLEREHNGQRPVNFILPKCIAATGSPLPRVRSLALTAINFFVERKPQAMLNLTDELMQALFRLAEDSNTDVRLQVCRSFVLLVEARPEKLVPHMSGLVEYFVSQHKTDNEDLSLEASEFWLSVCEHDELWETLTPYVERIVPVLLDSMVYSAEDIALLGGASDDEDEDDREEDIKPKFAKQAEKRNANHNGASADSAQNGNAYEKLASMDDDLEEGEIDELDEDGDENPDERWTVRKCSAAALDVFARRFGDPIFQYILPYLLKNLRSGEWPNREAAVLALGAVAEGCINAVTPHLPDLVPYLVTLLNDQEPVVRQITCWTLGRYGPWAVELPEPQKQTYLLPLIEGLLTSMLDKNKKVQEAAASAMATLEETVGKKVEPYVEPIVRQYVQCFGKYKDRNMYILYDCVQTLAEQVGPVLARPDLVNQLMPCLIDRWQKVGDQARELFPLLECLSYVAMALGDAFVPYAEPIFNRGVNIIHQNLEQSLASVQNSGVDAPDKDFLVTSLDLLSAIIQALDDSKAAELVSATQPAFFELLSFCMEDPADAVQQSAFALLGDCSKYIFPQLQPFLPSILPILVKRLDLDNILDEDADRAFSVVNNACWSAGEIAMQHKQGMAPYVPELLQRCVEILSNPRMPKGVGENAAIALGRLGLDNADQLAPHLGTFAQDFLNAMDDVDQSEEKATAFKGFCIVVSKNPQAMEKDLLHFFVSIARYRDLKLRNPSKQELHDTFQNVINLYRQLIPQFNDFLNQLQPQDQEALKVTFSI